MNSLLYYTFLATLATFTAAAPNPAVNRIDAVGDRMIAQSVVSFPGGTPVTLEASDAQELYEESTNTAVATVPMLLVSANPTAAAQNSYLSAASAPEPSSSAIKYAVLNTNTILYLTFKPQEPIDKLSMGQSLAQAMADLRQQMRLPKDQWLPYDEWTYIEDKWSCLITAESSSMPGPMGVKQHLTYGILHSAVAGLWQVMYVEGRFYEVDFAIENAPWGIMGFGTMKQWNAAPGGIASS
ncbi:hypothetical protein MMC28_001424 [Mycoblastus sanguinarius]|nr:hypothetical protein [Mycoblastus sanguinarius]